MLNTYQNKKEPDILEVISDLSNDEVFTPPSVAREMLDLLPSSVWLDPSLRWIDPFTKTGVFLREITKRLLVGLEGKIPDEQKRLDHILRNMVFGIAVTELTSLMSRRSLYCSKWADSEKSVVKFPNKHGNLFFQRVEHDFSRGRCSECLASEARHGGESKAENYAYPFLHLGGRHLIEKEIGLKFDIVVGNPPYQMEADDAGQNVNPIYNLFIDQAVALNPSFICMITPSRWMAGGKGLDEFRASMLQDKRILKIVDFPRAAEVFPGVGENIKGGVSYFLWDREANSDCEYVQIRNGEVTTKARRDLSEFDIFVRETSIIPLIRRVTSRKDFKAFSALVSTRDPFGPELSSNFKKYKEKLESKKTDLKLHLNVANKRTTKYVDKKFVTRNLHLVDEWKLFLPKAYGAGEEIPHQIIGQPILAGPGEVCTLSYLVCGPFRSKDEAESAMSYLKTKTARMLISARKISQNTTQSVYDWLPILPFDRTYTDELLRSEFQLSAEDIELINRNIKEMN
jgi:site-specific DNA-methyltransferase (adenine-specific)